MSASTDVPQGQRKPKPGVAGEVPWGPALSGPCENNGPEYMTPGRAALDSAKKIVPAFPPNEQIGPFATSKYYQDGHHPDDRWNLTDQQIGVGVPHEHDDWKRSQNTIIDQDPQAVAQGWHAVTRAPDDKKKLLNKPGDQLPTTT